MRLWPNLDYSMTKCVKVLSYELQLREFTQDIVLLSNNWRRQKCSQIFVFHLSNHTQIGMNRTRLKNNWRRTLISFEEGKQHMYCTNLKNCCIYACVNIANWTDQMQQNIGQCLPIDSLEMVNRYTWIEVSGQGRWHRGQKIFTPTQIRNDWNRLHYFK